VHIDAMKPMQSGKDRLKPPRPERRRRRGPGLFAPLKIIMNLAWLAGTVGLVWFGWKTIRSTPAPIRQATQAVQGRPDPVALLATLQALQKAGATGNTQDAPGPDETERLMAQAGLDPAVTGMNGGGEAPPSGEKEPSAGRAPDQGAPLKTYEQAGLPDLAALMAKPALRRAATAPIRVGIDGLRRGQRVRGVVPLRVTVKGTTAPVQVELRVNGEWIGMANHPPYQFEWESGTQSPGPYRIQAIVTDASGQAHHSALIPVTVLP
jgi:hypothetical protein